MREDIGTNYPEAQYTMTYYEFRHRCPDFISEVFELDTDDHTALFTDIFSAKWDMYEIVVADMDLEKLFIGNTFKLKKDYYLEKINAYEQEFDFNDAMEITTESSDDMTDDLSIKDLHVDLPNKKISSSNIYDYPDSGNKTDNHDERSSNTTSTTTNKNLYYSVKAQYMKQIRNWFEAFANEFKDCFMHIF